MNRSFFFAITVFIAAFVISAAASALVVHPWAIYGEDDRREVYEANSPAHQILAESVVALIESKAISKNTTGNLTITSEIYGEDYQLCATERFVTQPDVAWCSGFLVAENVIATAGHCVEDRDFCKDTKFVFDYMYETKSRNPLIAERDDVYGCKRIISEKYEKDGVDYALVELDRPAVGRTPLKIATKKPSVDESLFIIGNPVGLPVKIADGARVMYHDKGFYVTDLDAFSGNSGAAVFNDNYEVAGILARGEDDFVLKGSCYVANPCKGDTCAGEDVTDPEFLAAALARHLAKKTGSKP